MCFQSIYKRLKNDFTFLNEYGFEYESDGKHYVQPYVKFRKLNYLLLIGFAYDRDSFFVTFFDDNVKLYPSDSKSIFADGWAKPIYVIDENTKVCGINYKGQLPYVKEIIISFLDLKK